MKRTSKAESRARFAHEPDATVMVPMPTYHRPWQRRGIRKIAPGKLVDARCWCDTRIVAVPIDEVSRGRTGSCGGAGCEGPG